MSDELETVKETKTIIKLGGADREIKFGFSAWAMLEDEYGNVGEFKNISDRMREKPFHTIPHLLYIGLRDKEGVTEEDVKNWLDESYGINDIKEIADVLQKAMNATLPKSKGTADPHKAGKK